MDVWKPFIFYEFGGDMNMMLFLWENTYFFNVLVILFCGLLSKTTIKFPWILVGGLEHDFYFP